MARGCVRWLVGVGWSGLLLGGILPLSGSPAWAEEIIFLHDGHTVQARKVEVIGDRLRIERPSGEIVDLPRSDVLSIHDVAPPTAAPSPPSAPRPDLTQQMNNEVRQQIQQQKRLAPPPRF